MTDTEPVAGPGSADSDFVAFVRAHTAELMRTAVLLTGTAHHAEDLMQATLTHLYPRWDTVAAADAPLAYVRRSMSNRFISGRRSPAARDVGMWELPDRPDGRDVAETVAAHCTVWQLLGTLPERQRAALVLRYFHDLTDEQIATDLDCRPATVRSLISRGTASMRSSLAGQTDRNDAIDRPGPGVANDDPDTDGAATGSGNVR